MGRLQSDSAHPTPPNTFSEGGVDVLVRTANPKVKRGGVLSVMQYPTPVSESERTSLVRILTDAETSIISGEEID